MKICNKLKCLNWHRPKSISVTKLSFCQNGPPRSTSFWLKKRLVTLIIFDLCLFKHFSLSQIFIISLYLILVLNLWNTYRDSKKAPSIAHIFQSLDLGLLNLPWFTLHLHCCRKIVRKPICRRHSVLLLLIIRLIYWDFNVKSWLLIAKYGFVQGVIVIKSCVILGCRRGWRIRNWRSAWKIVLDNIKVTCNI